MRLPTSFMPADTTRVIGAAPSRAAQGLPDKAFVFCCFNHAWKITEPVFAVWMRLLKAAPASVLWLKAAADDTRAHLLAHAAAHGVEPARLIFAGHEAADIHLARHALADLFLDTAPYNAHATASDALWAGLPVLTCAGRSFAGRVAASLLEALQLPELVTDDLAAYEALALRLTQDPAMLAALRAKLAQGRKQTPLFDMPGLARHLEAAYQRMIKTAARGEKPESFTIAP